MNASERTSLLRTLQQRFEAHMHRHEGVSWAAVLARLDAQPTLLDVLQRMEATEGEPDVIGGATAAGEFVFVDCAAESPAGRRSLCYDDDALLARKENRPAGSAVAVDSHGASGKAIDRAPLGTAPVFVMANATWFKGLPKDQQDLLLEVGREISKEATAQSMAGNAAALKEMVEKKGGKITTLTGKALEEFVQLDREKTEPELVR